MMRKIGVLIAAAAAALFTLAAMPAAAQYYGNPGWLSDPTGLCNYPGRTGCGLVENPEPLPIGATAVTAASGNVAAGTVTATMPAVSAKTNWLTGFSITGGGATGASVISCTVTGLIGGTQTYTFAVPAGATLGATPFVRTYTWPASASAVNTAIAVSCPTFGAGNTNESVNLEGFVR